jgi:hypothetical protein
MQSSLWITTLNDFKISESKVRVTEIDHLRRRRSAALGVVSCETPYRRGSKFVGALARRACLVQPRGMTKQCSEFGRYPSSAVSEIGRGLLVAGLRRLVRHGDGLKAAWGRMNSTAGSQGPRKRRGDPSRLARRADPSGEGVRALRGSDSRHGQGIVHALWGPAPCHGAA